MDGFWGAAFGFPAVLFTFGLVVVGGYWVLVLLGGTDLDALDTAGSDIDAGDSGDADGFVGILASLGLGGIPVAVVLSVLMALAWLLSLVGEVAVRAAPDWTPLRVVLGALVLPAALAGAWAGTFAMVRPLRRLLPDGHAASRGDFLGRTCVVRTGRVGPDFGQAEVTAPDGASAVIQVRLITAAARPAGWIALIYEYDADGEVFWITPLDPRPEPDGPAGVTDLRKD